MSYYYVWAALGVALWLGAVLIAWSLVAMAKKDDVFLEGLESELRREPGIPAAPPHLRSAHRPGSPEIARTESPPPAVLNRPS